MVEYEVFIENVAFSVYLMTRQPNHNKTISGGRGEAKNEII